MALRAALQEEHLDRATRRLAERQPGGDDAGVVDHQHVAGVQEIGQIGDGGVRRWPPRPEVHQQPSGVAWLGR